MTPGARLRAAFEEAVGYAGEREQFGRPINRFQAVQAHLADNMATDLEAARRMTHWAAWRSDQGLENAHEASLAKLFCSEAATRTFPFEDSVRSAPNVGRKPFALRPVLEIQVGRRS